MIMMNEDNEEHEDMTMTSNRLSMMRVIKERRNKMTKIIKNESKV